MSLNDWPSLKMANSIVLQKSMVIVIGDLVPVFVIQDIKVAPAKIVIQIIIVWDLCVTKSACVPIIVLLLGDM